MYSLLFEYQEKERLMSNVTIPISLTLTFSQMSGGANVRWESDVTNIPSSQFVSPYSTADLKLVIHALDVLQYPNYPLPMTRSQERLFTFNDEDQVQLDTLGLWDSAGRVHAAAPQHVGRTLYRALTIDAKGSQALATVRDTATYNGQPIEFRLRFPPEMIDLSALPWELLWDDGPTPLLLSRGQLAACTRHLDLAQALPPPHQRTRTLHVLPIAPLADIPDVVRAEEREARVKAWGALIASSQVIMEPDVTPATPRNLVDAIQKAKLRGQSPDIIHYYGHGRYKDGEGALLLDLEGGGRNWISASTLMALFGDVRLVMLYACQTAMVEADADSLLTGVAPALSAAGVPFVVAMQLTTRIAAATRSSEVIYRALAAGQSLQDAVSLARQALFIDEQDRVSWYVPSIYIRSRETGPAYLLAPEAKPAATTSAQSTRPPARHGTSQSIVASGGAKIRKVSQRGGADSNQRITAKNKGLVSDSEQIAQHASRQNMTADTGTIEGAYQSDEADKETPDEP